MRMRTLAVAAAVFSLTGCGLGVVAGADYAPSVDFSPYRSYTWDEPDDRPIGDPRLENNPFFEERLHAAIAVELAEHDIRSSGSGARLIVHHHATVRSRVDVYETDERAGYGAPRYSEGRQVLQYDEGTILVDIADAATKDVLWRGWAQFDISRALANPEVMTRAIDEAIRKMFQSFPGPER
jgi:predicted small lipoprotein YifL